jgi:aminobenzoyl-glutamate transport protein
VFFRLRRNPLAGLAAGFAGVGVTFGVNLIIQPTDAMITEIANEAITLTGGRPISVVSNFYFSAVSLIILCVVATFITERMIEPRLGVYDFTSPEAIEVGVAEAAGGQRGAGGAEDASAAEVRGLRFALFGFLAMLVIVLLATLPPGAPLRDPQTSDIIGATPSWTACSSSSCASSWRRASATALAPGPSRAPTMSLQRLPRPSPASAGWS